MVRAEIKRRLADSFNIKLATNHTNITNKRILKFLIRVHSCDSWLISLFKPNVFNFQPPGIKHFFIEPQNAFAINACRRFNVIRKRVENLFALISRRARKQMPERQSVVRFDSLIIVCKDWRPPPSKSNLKRAF